MISQLYQSLEQLWLLGSRARIRAPALFAAVFEGRGGVLKQTAARYGNNKQFYAKDLGPHWQTGSHSIATRARSMADVALLPLLDVPVRPILVGQGWLGQGMVGQERVRQEEFEQLLTTLEIQAFGPLGILLIPL